MAPRDFVNRLRANVDDWYADRTTYEVFGERQGATWREIEARGKSFVAAVSYLLRTTEGAQ